jgi:hypothetical protein
MNDSTFPRWFRTPLRRNRSLGFLKKKKDGWQLWKVRNEKERDTLPVEMPTNFLRMASLLEACNILSLILAVSGDLEEKGT